MKASDWSRELGVSEYSQFSSSILLLSCSKVYIYYTKVLIII